MLADLNLDFADCRGLTEPITLVAEAVRAQRAILLMGPPGIGKTMLARRITSIMPRPDELAADWLRAEYTGLGFDLSSEREIVESEPGVFARRMKIAVPFRAPHHTISNEALAGSGRDRPGSVSSIRVCERTDLLRERGPHRSVQVTRATEVDLARFGVLFLDELSEFRTAGLDALARRLSTMPGRPQIVASAQPCACGWHGWVDGSRECQCSPESRARFGAYVSHAISIFATRGILFNVINLPSVSLGTLRAGAPGPRSSDLRMSVVASCHNGTDWCVRDATTADGPDELWTAVEARAEAAKLAVEYKCKWFDFGGAS